jgi:iron complex transport system ATP-binding protein
MTLQIRGLGAGYQGSECLSGIDLDAAAGELVAVVGPNGAGKSTLLRAVSRLLAPRRGRVLLAGRDVATLDPRERARRIAYLPQVAAPPGVRVLDALLLGRMPYLRRRPGPADLAVVEEAVTALRLEPFLERAVTTLSGGELQKVLLARALVQQPELLLLDEPTNHLDPRNQLEVLAAVRELCSAAGMTTLVVLHDVNHALRFADSVAMLAGGRLAAQRPAAAISEADLEAVYGMTARFCRAPGVRLAHFDAPRAAARAEAAA